MITDLLVDWIKTCLSGDRSNQELYLVLHSWSSFRDVDTIKNAAPQDLMEYPHGLSSSIHRCTVCSAPSSGYHFNAPSCSACAAFFRRTVTLGRHFLCAHQGNCMVHFEMRIICRACRYAKCVRMGMDRQAVQPRRDNNRCRRKITYSKRSHEENVADTVAVTRESSAPSPGTHSYSSSASEELNSPHSLISSPETPQSVLEMLLREERLYNERRSILYCVKNTISEILSSGEVNDIPFSSKDLSELTFAEIRKDIRAQILATYEWIRGWTHFKCLSSTDKKILLRRCTLFHPIIDPCYLTTRLGLPDRFVMFNGMFVGIAAESEQGWRDETCISANLKKDLYRPLLDRVLTEIVLPMKCINISFVEYVVLKALVTFKSTSTANVSASLKRCLLSQIDFILAALSIHYTSLGMSTDEIAVRTGNVVLLVGNVFEVGMQCLESHQVIQFFDLWKLDDLLIKLISESTQHFARRTAD